MLNPKNGFASGVIQGIVIASGKETTCLLLVQYLQYNNLTEDYLGQL